MIARESKNSKGSYFADVVANERLNTRFCLLTVRLEKQAAKTFKNTAPGQFVEIDTAPLALPAAKDIPEALCDKAQKDVILRRPFSFADVKVKGETVLLEIMYCVLGPATLRMTTLKKNDSVGIIGPLGNGFKIKQQGVALLVAGGMGAPPLRHLQSYMKSNYPSVKILSFEGAKTADELPFKPLKDTFVATDDGSAGFKGFITEMLEKRLSEKDINSGDAVIYSCGPEPMLKRVAEIAEKYNVPCQLSLERMMACGIGLCQSCAVSCKDGGYKLCCKDGPVFDGKDVEW